MLTLGAILQERYTILDVLGQGGMGIVYSARDRRLDTQCVVKEMALAGQMSEIREYATRQFEREAKVLAALHHQHLPRVIDYFEERDSYFLVMDFIEGESLLHAIKNRGVAEQQVLGYAVQILNVLEYIHKHNVLHRDIKPANIIIKPNGDAVLIDFGLAKLLLGKSTALTSTILGTFEYAPPEQLNGNTDERSDIYALGATLYHALTGNPPLDIGARFSGITLPNIGTVNPTISARTAQVVHKALELNSAQRFDSTAMMRDALIRDAPPPPPPTKHGNLKGVIGVLGSIAGIAVVGVVATLLFGGGPGTPTPTMTPAVPPQRISVVAGAADAPTNTPIPPTSTLAPTNTSEPTQTPVTPTSTPKPTATPTDTPSPTPTPSSTPTTQPTPTYTPTPSDTCFPRWFFSPNPANEGCLENYRAATASIQRYDSGFILWIGDGQLDNQVFVFTGGGEWENAQGNIDSVGSARASRLGSPTGGRTNFNTCAAHSNANGLVTAYASDSSGRILWWRITATGYVHQGWGYVQNAQFLGCYP